MNNPLEIVDESELLERYRSNNCDLALALNEMKTELAVANYQLVRKERALQAKQDENAILKRDLTQCQTQLVQCQTQLSSWRALIFDMVQSNTKKYTEMMAVVGLMKAPQAPAAPTTPLPPQPTATTSNVTARPSNARTEAIRRRRHSVDSPQRLADLTEESTANTSDVMSSPPSSAAAENVIGRRRAQSPPRKRIIRHEPNAEPRRADAVTSSSTESLDGLGDGDKENVLSNVTSRPSRRTAPKNLAEPKLSTKLRRE